MISCSVPGTEDTHSIVVYAVLTYIFFIKAMAGHDNASHFFELNLAQHIEVTSSSITIKLAIIPDCVSTAVCKTRPALFVCHPSLYDTQTLPLGILYTSQVL